MQVREKVEKSRNTVFFQWFVAPEGRKVGSPKRRVRATRPDERWTIARRCGSKHIWKSKCTKHLMFGHVRTTFGSWDVEKVHAVVARSEAHLEVTFGSQNVQNTTFLDHFWKLRCRKSARRCGAKHISKSKRTKRTRFGTLFEVEMSKKCTPLWREARFEVKSKKKWRVGSTFGRSDVVLRGRHKGFCTLPKVRRAWEFWSTFNYNHYTTLHYTTLHSTTTTTITTTTTTTTTSLHYTNYNALHELHYTQLHYTTLHYTMLTTTTTTQHFTTLITLHCTTWHHTTPHHTTLH